MNLRPPLVLTALATALSVLPLTAGAAAGPRNPATYPGRGSAPASQPAGGNRGTAPGATEGDAVNNSTSMLERFFNSDRWSVDTENGGFTFGNMKFDLGSNRLLRSRFERYLALPLPESDAKAYQDILTKINDLLSVGNTQGTSGENAFEAWKLLFEAAKFEQDGGTSMVIANQVFNAWRIRDERNNNLIARADLEREQKRQEDLVRAANDYKQYQRRQDQALRPTQSRNAAINQAIANRGAQQGGGQPNQGGNQQNQRGGTTTVGGTIGTNPDGDPMGNLSFGSGGASGDDGNGAGGPGLGNVIIPGPGVTPSANADKAAFLYIDLLRTNANITALDTQMAIAGINAQMQFQTTALYFLVTRRFEHSLISGQFYRNIFKGSNQAVTISRNELSKFMDLRDTVPTMDSFEGLSRDAINDVKLGMRAVETSYDLGDRWGALERLQETFLLGEYQPPVVSFDPAKRRVLFEIYRYASDLRKLVQNKDFAAVDETVNKLREAAKDFPAAEIQSAVRTAQQTSRLALLSAKQSMIAGDMENAKAQLEQAVDIWPLNPDIKGFLSGVDTATDLKATWVPRLNDWIARGEYRQIYKNRAELGFATLDDPDAAAKLKEVVERMATVDMLVAYGDAAVKQKNPYAAWEMLAKAAKLDPNDPIVARAQADLAPQVANFVSALSAAQRAASAGEYSTSLNYYLAAQDIYPTSEICSEGIAQAGKEMLARLNPGGATARMLQNRRDAAPPPAAPANSAAPPVPPAPPLAANTPGSAPAGGNSGNLF